MIQTKGAKLSLERFITLIKFIGWKEHPFVFVEFQEFRKFDRIIFFKRDSFYSIKNMGAIDIVALVEEIPVDAIIAMCIEPTDSMEEYYKTVFGPNVRIIKDTK